MENNDYECFTLDKSNRFKIWNIQKLFFSFVCFCSGNFFWFSPNMYNVNLIHIKYTLDFRSDEIFFPSPKHFSNLVQKKESNTSSCLTCLYLTASVREYIFTPILTKGLHPYSNIRVSTLRPTPYTLMRTSAKLLYSLLKIDSTILQVTNPDVWVHNSK